jgi:dCTP deaminase
MSFLSDVEIKDAIQSKDISIEPFDERDLEPSSYDFRVGRALIAGKGVSGKEDFPLYLKPGDWMEIESLENVKISQKIGVIIGMPSGMSRKGILAFSGLHIDPGYRGKIFITLFNPSSDTFKIECEQKLCTLIFFKFDKNPSKTYEGKYQDQYGFPEKDIEWMIRLKAPTIADAIRSVEKLEVMIDEVKGDVSEIRNDFKLYKNDVTWIKNILLGILAALVVGIGIAVVTKFI